MWEWCLTLKITSFIVTTILSRGQGLSGMSEFLLLGCSTNLSPTSKTTDFITKQLGFGCLLGRCIPAKGRHFQKPERTLL